MADTPKPLSPARATSYIRGKVGPDLSLLYTDHAKAQMAERDLIMSDVLYVLKNGFVYQGAQNATQTGFFKYAMESTSPNSGGRTVRVIVIPSNGAALKVVTVMWVDEDRVGS